MLKVMLQKLWHKKWMCVCLLTGILLLIASVVSFPMYRDAAYTRMLKDEFDEYLSETGEWPALSSITYVSNAGEDASVIRRMENFVDQYYGQLGLTEKETVSYYCIARVPAHSLMERVGLEDLQLRVAFISGLEDQITLLKGESYSEDGMTEDGCLEAVITSSCMVNCNLLPGETVEFDTITDPAGNPLRIRIVGIFEAADLQDPYWQVSTEMLSNVCLIREPLFQEYLVEQGAEKYRISCEYYPMWDYSLLEAEDVDHLYDTTAYTISKGPYAKTFGEEEPPYMGILDTYIQKRNRINTALLLLQVPVWILLGLFLLMISAQMYEVERNEISVMKSRGSSGLQIFLLYFYQSVFLTCLGCLAALPLGKLFARGLGATGSFLEFGVKRDLEVRYTGGTFLYALAAMAVCILMITLPAIRHSRVSIVNLKQQRASLKRSWWEVCFLDIICLAVGIYGYWTCVKNEESIFLGAITGQPMEALLYVSSSLFILGAGLLLLRLQPLIMGLIYFIGKRFWGVASYISFIENRKEGKKQHFIMLFLILSISLAMYYSAAARSILQNAQENAEYLAGADLVVKEQWEDNSAFTYNGVAEKLLYEEPNFDKYLTLPCAKAYTRVIYDRNGHIFTSRFNEEITIMGIHTREFGEITSLPRGLGEKSYHEYLNELAQNPDGVLMSFYFADMFDVGDTVVLSNGDGKEFQGKVIDFITYWPSYNYRGTLEAFEDTFVQNPDFFVVANIGTLTEEWGVVPYEVWIDTGGKGAEGFRQWLKEEDVHLERYVDKQEELDRVTEDPLLQGTNGILTMEFLVTILLCATGYLIYWILSIRSREMLFGIFRANGMHKREVYHLLVNEQIFCGGVSVAAGAVIGYISSKMFVPVLQVAFSEYDQVLPRHLVMQWQDAARLFGVVGVVLLICLAVLMILIRKLDIVKALKLGEE